MARTKNTQTDSDSGRTVQVIKGQDTASTDQLRNKIAETAYYRAEQRGFKGGNPVEDWLTAERDIKSHGQAR